MEKRIENIERIIYKILIILSILSFSIIALKFFFFLYEKIELQKQSYSNPIVEYKYNLDEGKIYILASIIQAETHCIEDMPKISAVFHNRLNRKMKLQSCATINFIRKVNGKKHKMYLKESDLQINSPYNTYRNYGLPPAPICIPSKEAIEAAKYPENDTKLLFFKYDSRKNKDVFSYTYKEHLLK